MKQLVLATIKDNKDHSRVILYFTIIPLFIFQIEGSSSGRLKI